MKKISAIIICLLMFLTCTLTGCAGFSVDRVKYYNEVVATVGTTEITRFELLNTYSSNSYFSQSGQSESEAINQVLNSLIDREALYQYALNYQPETGANPYKPTEYQINEIVKAIFDSVDGQIEDFITNAKRALNIEIVEKPADEQQQTVYKREDYDFKKRAKIVIDGEKTVYYKDEAHTQLADAADIQAGNAYAVTEPNYKIQYITETEPAKGNYVELIDEKFLKDYTLVAGSTAPARDIVEEIRNKYLAHLHDDLVETENENADPIYNEILKFLSQSLINYEFYLRDKQGNPYSKNTNDLLYRYFQRMFESQIKQQFLTNFQEYYLKNENLSLDELLKAFREITTHDFEKYVVSADYKADMKNTSTDFEKILLHPNIDEDAQFGYFLHTLFQFSDEQKAQIETLAKKYGSKQFKDYAAEYKEKLENPKLDEATKLSLTQAFNAYKNEYTSIVLNTKVVVRDLKTGAETDQSNTLTLRQLLQSNEFENLACNPNIYDFVDFMFAHTQDNATLTANAPYVVGSYDEAKGETYTTNSAMEQAFTDEAIKLMQTKQNGTLSNLYSNTDGGLDVENFCITSYGVHILYYICPLYENNISYGSIKQAYFQPNSNRNDDPEGKLNLYTKFLNPLSELKGKTYFDLLFDIVYPASDKTFTSNTNYSEYEKSLAEIAKSAYKVVKYSTRIKATTTSL